MPSNHYINTAFIGIGSNMGHSEELLSKAVELINNAQGLDVTDLSNIYFTEPQDLKNQPWFTNQVIRLQYTKKWQAQILLAFLHDIEQKLGRVRFAKENLRYGPRCIDLDLLLFGTESSLDPACTIPHPRMTQRAFVLIPLRDVCRQDILPFELEYCLNKLKFRVEGNKIFQSNN